MGHGWVGVGVVGGWLRDRQGVEFWHGPRLAAGSWVCHIFGYKTVTSFFPRAVLRRNVPMKVPKFGFCS